MKKESTVQMIRSMALVLFLILGANLNLAQAGFGGFGTSNVKPVTQNPTDGTRFDSIYMFSPSFIENVAIVSYTGIWANLNPAYWADATTTNFLAKQLGTQTTKQRYISDDGGHFRTAYVGSPNPFLQNEYSPIMQNMLVFPNGVVYNAGTLATFFTNHIDQLPLAEQNARADLADMGINVPPGGIIGIMALKASLLKDLLRAYGHTIPDTIEQGEALAAGDGYTWDSASAKYVWHHQ